MIAPANPASAVSPAPVWDVINGFSGYWALLTALDLGVFDALDAAGSNGLDSARLAAAVGANDAAAVRLLAETLVSLGLLDTDGTTFAPTPAAARYLVSSSPASMAALVRYSPGPLRAWPQLADTIRTGVVAPAIADELARFYPDLVRATAPTQAAVATAVAQELDARGLWPERPSVVDLGCGSGAWLTALLGARLGGTAVAVDLPNVLPVAEQALAAAGLTDRVTAVPGDYLAVDLPVRGADVVVLAHVLRAEPAARAQQLLVRAIELAGSSGVVVVADYPRPDPPDAASSDHAPTCAAARHELLLSLTMLSSTTGLGVSVADLRAWAASAGAEVVHTFDALPRQHVYLIRARNPEGRS